MNCPKCGNELKWISQYSRYYCKGCKDYPKVGDLAEGQFREDVQNQLELIAKGIWNGQEDTNRELKSIKHGVWILVYIVVGVIVISVVFVVALLLLILSAIPDF